MTMNDPLIFVKRSIANRRTRDLMNRSAELIRYIAEKPVNDHTISLRAIVSHLHLEIERRTTGPFDRPPSAA